MELALGKSCEVASDIGFSGFIGYNGCSGNTPFKWHCLHTRGLLVHVMGASIVAF